MEMLLQLLNDIHPVSENLTDYLKEHVQVKELQRKDKLLKAGHVTRHIYFIESGLLRHNYKKRNFVAGEPKGFTRFGEI